jgi:hypothetical protein
MSRENEEWKTIRVSRGVYDYLRKKGYVDESFDDVLRRELGLPPRDAVDKVIKELYQKRGIRSGYERPEFEDAAKKIYNLSEEEIRMEVKEADNPPKAIPVPDDYCWKPVYPRLSFSVGNIEFAWLDFAKTTSTLYYDYIQRDEVGGGIKWEHKDYLPQDHKSKFDSEVLPKIEDAYRLTKKIEVEKKEGKEEIK